MNYFVVKNSLGEKLELPVTHFAKVSNYRLFFSKNERISNDNSDEIKAGDHLKYLGPGESRQHDLVVSDYLKMVINKNYKIEELKFVPKKELLGMHI